MYNPEEQDIGTMFDFSCESSEESPIQKSDIYDSGLLPGLKEYETVIENITNDGPVADLSQVPTLDKEGEGEPRDLKSFKNLITLESIIFKLYSDDMKSDVFKEMARALDCYEHWATKPVDSVLANKIANGLKACEERKLTKEEAKKLVDLSSRVDNNVYSKIECFLAHKEGHIALIDVVSQKMYHCAGEGLEAFLGDKLEGPSEVVPRNMLANYVSMFSSMQGNKNPHKINNLARLRRDPFFFNCLIDQVERQQTIDFLEKSIRNFDPAKAALTNAQAFSYKVTGKNPKEYVEVLSPQIVESLIDHFAGQNDKIVQIVRTRRGNKGPIYGDKVDTIYCADDGQFGGRKDLILSIEQLMQKPDERIKPSSKLLKGYQSILDSGAARNKEGVLHIATKWDSTLSDKELVENRTMGVVKPAVFTTMYAKLKKEGVYLERNEDWWNSAYASMLICPISQTILMIPKWFLKPDSSVRLGRSTIGFSITSGLIRNINTFSAGFALGLVKAGDWDNLVPKEIVEQTSLFGGSKVHFGQHYPLFVGRMVNWLNSLRSTIVVYPGTKKHVDRDVLDFLGEESWHVPDDDVDPGPDHEMVIEEIDF